MPAAWIGPRVPGRKNARIGSWVSTWLMNTTCPPSAIARFAVSPVSAISSCITAARLLDQAGAAEEGAADAERLLPDEPELRRRLRPRRCRAPRRSRAPGRPSPAPARTPRPARSATCPRRRPAPSGSCTARSSAWIVVCSGLGLKARGRPRWRLSWSIESVAWFLAILSAIRRLIPEARNSSRLAIKTIHSA